MNIDVVYDGKCGVCTRIVRELKQIDKRGVLTFRTCQSIGLDGWRGVTPSACHREIWALADNGMVATGADAASLIFTAMIDNWWPWRIGRLPVIRQILSLGYRIIAKNRRRFPGDTPWCEQHPEDCMTEFQKERAKRKAQ